jgi:hypothetical protein
VSPELAARILGAPEFIAWFGRVPRFHDGSVLEFTLDLSRCGHLRVKTFRMNPDTDDKGYFRLDKHCIVTFQFEEVTVADLVFEDAAEIIDNITINAHDDGFEMEINAINGFDGMLRMKSLRLAFEPDETAR